jgi:hypothetical protein
MLINSVLTIIFLCINTSFHLNAHQNQIWYNNNLDRYLFENGTSYFIDRSKDASDKDYTDALWDIVKLASINGYNASRLLQSIHNNIEQRIKQIESLKNKWVDRKKLIHGLKSIALGIASSYVVYYLYKKYCSPINKEYDNIKKSLEDRGMKIVFHHTKHFETGRGFVDPGTTLYVPHGASNYEDSFLKLLELSEKSNDIEGKLFGGATIPLLGLFYYGIDNVYWSFHPNHDDDKYLEKYQSLLEITKAVQKSYALECA